MQLSFLEFDHTDNGDDTHTLEAMASVPPARVAAVLAEVAQVLTWAHHGFPGGPQPLDEGGDWDLLLQAQLDDEAPLTLHPSKSTGWLAPLPAGGGGDGRAPAWVAITLTLAARPAFSHALWSATGA